jgi:positive regulator of sigma E activity
MKIIRYNLIFFIFYSVFLTLSLFLFDRPAWRDMISAAIVSLLMVLVFYLFDRYRERKKKDKVE